MKILHTEKLLKRYDFIVIGESCRAQGPRTLYRAPRVFSTFIISLMPGADRDAKVFSTDVRIFSV
jgi:hypothetical protein